MNSKKIELCLIIICLMSFTVTLPTQLPSAGTNQNEQLVINLAGQWDFRLDPQNIGETEQWYQIDLPHQIKLPGSTAENGYGDDNSVDTKWTGDIFDSTWFTNKKYEKYRQPGQVKLPFWLTPVKHYIGAAWYQKIVEIPDDWRDKSILLFLERAHWETELWVDGKEIGIQNSLSTPHEYDLGTLRPGRHRLTIRVDNTVKIEVGNNSHSICDHSQTNWNGIIGKIELRVVSPVWLNDLQVYPDVQKKLPESALLSVMIPECRLRERLHFRHEPPPFVKSNMSWQQ